ncbi:MAG: TerB family tellurite resistance protein [Methyloceanibacter sp.]
MSLWTSFKEFADRVSGEQVPARNLREEELRLAAAALLVHGTVVDGTVEPEERRKLKAILQTRFDLDAGEARKLLGEAEVREHDAVDIYRFTSVLCRELDQDGRKRIVEMLWEVVMADGVVHEFENNLVWRAAELLGVSTRDRITLRKAVESRSG